jgi:Reverse transcriptase (RNA-dependent DNA polymerase)
MLNSADLKDQLRSGVWAECALTVTFPSNITSIKNQEICPYQLLYGCKPRLPASLRSFGEIGIVTTKDKIQGKLNNRGTPCMFVGYTLHHAHDVYRMLKIETAMIINSQDIIWLNEMHKDWIGRKVKNQLIDDDEDADVMESKILLLNEGQEASQAVTSQDDLKRTKLYRQLRQLENSFNPDAAKLVEQIEQGREILLDQVNLALISGMVINEEPTTFEQAWNHQDPKVRERWREAINKEFDEMSKKEVWEIIKKENIPKNRRTVKCKWIFKIKQNGIFRARLVAYGYSQIPGIDFNESFVLVINDASFQIMLVAKLIWKLKACIVDVEIAFLHGELQEEIY